MTLKTIELENFRNFDRKAFRFTQPRTLIIGENGVGKSTIADAIAWAGTSRCRGVDGKGAGQKELIRWGANSMQVTMNVTGLPAVIRAYGKNSSSSMTPGEFLGRLGVSQAMFMGVLYGRTFFELHHSEAKNMLMDLLGVTVPRSELDGIDLPEGDEDIDIRVLDAAFESAFANRANAKKVRDAIHVPDVVSRVDLEKLDVATVAAAQTAARQAYQSAARAEATAAADVKNLKEAIANLELRLGNAEQQRGALRTHQEMLADHQQKLDAAKAALEELEAKNTDSESELGAQVSERTLLVQKIQAHKPDRGCILAGDIPCNTAAKHFTGHIDTIKKGTAALERRIVAARKHGQALGAAEQDVRNHERQVVYHSGQVREIQEDLDDLAARAGSIADSRADLEIKQSVQAAAAAEMEAAKEQMDALQKQHQELTTYRSEMKNMTAAFERRAAAEQDVTNLERVVELLGPKGVRARALQAALESFEQMINMALQPFDFSLSISVDPWRVNVTTKRGTFAYTMLSVGEQLWTGLAFQLALAAASGLNFAMLDASESVVGNRRSILTALVMAAPIDQVIVAMAKSDAEQAPEIDGLQVIRIDQ
jgi:DNA repair exonuclease SbcCD ATPase subunit